jgi:hypothetical protein
MGIFNKEDIFLSFKEDIIDVLIRKGISYETALEVIKENELEKRFMNDPEQFDLFEPDEVATLFFKTYEIIAERKNIN